MSTIKELNTLLLKKAEEVIKKSGLNITLVIKDLGEGTNAEYNKLKNTIAVNLRVIIKCSQFSDVSAIDYLEVVLCHELGHAIDQDLTLELLEKIKLLKESYSIELEHLDLIHKPEERMEQNVKLLKILKDLKEVEYPAEFKACRLGEAFVPKHLLEMYKKHSNEILDAYLASYEHIEE